MAHKDQGSSVKLKREFIREAREKRDQASSKVDGSKITLGSFIEQMAKKGWGNELQNNKR